MTDKCKAEGLKVAPAEGTCLLSSSLQCVHKFVIGLRSKSAIVLLDLLHVSGMQSTVEKHMLRAHAWHTGMGMGEQFSCLPA